MLFGILPLYINALVYSRGWLALRERIREQTKTANITCLRGGIQNEKHIR